MFLNKLLFSLYYPYCACLDRLLPSITLDGRKLRVLPGVYKPLDSEHRLADLIDEGKDVLDVGCGSGVITLFAAAKSRHVTAIDISPQAIANTQLNCARHGIENVSIQQSDMFREVRGHFDYILSYPPLFQTSFQSSDKQWCTSTTFIDRLFSGAREHLKPHGRLLVLLPSIFRESPAELGARHGLVLDRAVPHFHRSLATRIHSLPYLHFNMKNHVYIFRPQEDSAAALLSNGRASI